MNGECAKYLDSGDLVNEAVHIVRPTYRCTGARVLSMGWLVCSLAFALLLFYLFPPVPVSANTMTRPFGIIWKKATVKCRNIISLIDWGYECITMFGLFWFSFSVLFLARICPAFLFHNLLSVWLRLFMVHLTLRSPLLYILPLLPYFTSLAHYFVNVFSFVLSFKHIFMAFSFRFVSNNTIDNTIFAVVLLHIILW